MALAAGPLTGAPAKSGSPKIFAPPPMSGGDSAVVNASVPVKKFCGLQLHLAHLSVKSKPAKAKQKNVQFVWKVPADAKPGNWRATVACGTSRAHLTRGPASSLVVSPAKGQQSAKGPLARPKDIRMLSLHGDARTGIGAASSGYPSWGQVVVSGSRWDVAGAAGRTCGGGVSWPCGVDVYSNRWGGWPYSPDGSSAFGWKWQCVELINRFLNQVGWYRGVIRGNGVDFWRDLPGMERRGNGSGYKPVPGDIVVYSGHGFGHVAIVEWDDGSHVGTIEQNVPSDQQGRTTLAFNGNTLTTRWGGFAILGFLHAQANGARTGPTGYHITVDNTPVYSGPGTQYSVAGHLSRGTQINVTCQRRTASSVSGSTIWDRLANGTYVSDYDVSTPNYNAFSPGIAQCPNAVARAISLHPNGAGYLLDDFGGVHAVGGAPAANGSAYWNDWDIARSIGVSPDGHSGYVMDGWGGLHPFGGAPPAGGGPYWPNWDIARSLALRPDGHSGYVLDGFGAIHPFNGAPALASSTYWPNWDIARSISLNPTGTGGYLLDGFGGIHPFGNAPSVGGSAYWPNWDIARAIAVGPNGTSGYVLDGYGGVHPFGGAPAVTVSRYTPNIDDARGLSIDATGHGGWVAFTDGGVAQFGDAPAVATSWHP